MKANYFLLVSAMALVANTAGAVQFPEKLNLTNVVEKDTTGIEYRNSYWIELGLGWSSRDLAFNASLNLEMKRRWIVSISSENVFSDDPILSGLIFFIPVYKPGYDFSAVNLKLGKAVKGNAGLIVFSGGMSFLKGTEYSSSAQLGTTSGVGAAFDIKFILAKNFIGLSLNPFFNINEIQSYTGLTINIALGQVNYAK